VFDGRWVSVTPSLFGVLLAIVRDGLRKRLQLLKLSVFRERPLS
jgi:hypothetical protein